MVEFATPRRRTSSANGCQITHIAIWSSLRVSLLRFALALAAIALLSGGCGRPPDPLPIPTATATPAPTAESGLAACLGASSYPERRPENAQANLKRVAVRPWTYNRAPEFRPYYAHLTADCQGSTEQILEWGARKWIPEAVVLAEGSRLELLKAVAAAESEWTQTGRGDHQVDHYCWTGPAPTFCWPTDEQSYGIVQVKRTVWPHSYPQSRQSTAFAVDYWGAAWRHCYDGASWLGPQTRGDVWGCVSTWFQGSDPNADSEYATRVKHHLRSRTWQGY